MYDKMTHIPLSDQNLQQFLTIYWENFPNSKISPKLHLLEDHVVPCLRRWHVVLVFHGEQGAESIHRVFNSLKRTYANIRNPVDRLKSIMKEHFLQNAPENKAAVPAVKRRKTSS